MQCKCGSAIIRRVMCYQMMHMSWATFHRFNSSTAGNMLQHVLELPHIRSAGGFCQKSSSVCVCVCVKPRKLCRTHSKFFFVFTTEAGSRSAAWTGGEHSTGLTQDMLTSASFSQKPIKLSVGRIIRPTDRARWPIVNSGEEEEKKKNGPNLH